MLILFIKQIAFRFLLVIKNSNLSYSTISKHFNSFVTEKPHKTEMWYRNVIQNEARSEES